MFGRFTPSPIRIVVGVVILGGVLLWLASQSASWRTTNPPVVEACPKPPPVKACPKPSHCPDCPTTSSSSSSSSSSTGPFSEVYYQDKRKEMASALTNPDYKFAMTHTKWHAPSGEPWTFLMSDGPGGEMGNNQNGMEVAVWAALEAAWNRGPKEDLLFLDIGANLGWYTYIAGKKGIRTTAFDPQPECANRNRFNVLLNAFTQTEVYNSGVSIKPGLKLQVPAAGCDGLYTFRVDNSENDKNTKLAEVPTISVDVAVSAWKGRFVAKIDTEGSEIDVLRSMKGILQTGRVSDMVIELLPKNWEKKGDTYTGGADFFKELMEQGYYIYAVYDSTPYKSSTVRAIPTPSIMPSSQPLWIVTDILGMIEDRGSRRVGCNIWITKTKYH